MRLNLTVHYLLLCFGSLLPSPHLLGLLLPRLTQHLLLFLGLPPLTLTLALVELGLQPQNSVALLLLLPVGALLGTLSLFPACRLPSLHLSKDQLFLILPLQDGLFLDQLDVTLSSQLHFLHLLIDLAQLVGALFEPPLEPLGYILCPRPFLLLLEFPHPLSHASLRLFGGLLPLHNLRSIALVFLL